MGRVATAYVGWGVKLPEDMHWGELEEALGGEDNFLTYTWWEDEVNEHLVIVDGGWDGEEQYALCWRPATQKGDEYDKVTALGVPETPSKEEWAEHAGPLLETLGVTDIPDPQCILVVNNI